MKKFAVFFLNAGIQGRKLQWGRVLASGRYQKESSEGEAWLSVFLALVNY